MYHVAVKHLENVLLIHTHQTFTIKLVRDVQPVHHPQDTQTEVGVKCITEEKQEKMSKLRRLLQLFFRLFYKYYFFTLPYKDSKNTHII